MKNKLALLLFLFPLFGSIAQVVTKEDLNRELKSFTEKIKSLEIDNTNLKTELSVVKSNITTLKLNYVSLATNVASNKSEISSTKSVLNAQIASSETTTNIKLGKINNSLSRNSLWSIIGILVAIIISGIVYRLISKRQASDKTDLIEKLSKTKSYIEETLVSEFEKQSELIKRQIKLIEEQNKNISTSTNESEIDHSLALKVADEITLIERNISLMDPSVKGLKHLSRSILKLKDNLLANGYELPELLGKNYNQGMKVIISSSVPDENLDPGAEVITKVIKPQVNYKEKMIQTAQIEVSVG